MASLWQKTLFYLGLVDEDQPNGAEDPFAAQGEVRTVEAPAGSTSSVRPPGAVAGRRVEPPSSSRRRVSSEPAHAEAGVYVQTADSRSYAYGRVESETEVIVARNFSDAQTLADGIRSNRAVVLDLRSTEPEMVRRLVDFASGLTYALDGKMSKIGQGVILVTPAGVSVSVNEQERLAALGLYAPGER